jgi:hypothetical protein
LKNISLNTAAHREIFKGDNLRLLTSVYLSRIERLLEGVANGVEAGQENDLDELCTKERVKQVMTVLNAIGNCLMTSEIRDMAHT